MIASTCQHFRFGGATASLKIWQLRIHDCKHLSTLPFCGRYSKPEKSTFKNPWLQALVNTSVLGALQETWKFDIWRSMIASTCQHFRFAGATASLKNWHWRIQNCKHLSTLPFWGRYGKPEKLTFNDPWLKAVVNTSLFPTKQNFQRCMAKPLVKLQFFKKHVMHPCGKAFFWWNAFKQKFSRTFFAPSSSSSSPIFTTIMIITIIVL